MQTKNEPEPKQNPDRRDWRSEFRVGSAEVETTGPGHILGDLEPSLPNPRFSVGESCRRVRRAHESCQDQRRQSSRSRPDLENSVYSDAAVLRGRKSPRQNCWDCQQGSDSFQITTRHRRRRFQNSRFRCKQCMNSNRGKTMGRRSDAREKLLAVAFELIWENSYGGVSVDQICDRAKVKKGSLYYFFRTKADVAIAACEDHWKTEQPELDRLFSSQVTPLERLSKWCDYVYQAQKDKSEKYGRVCGCPIASIGVEMATRQEKIRIKAEEL